MVPSLASFVGNRGQAHLDVRSLWRLLAMEVPASVKIASIRITVGESSMWKRLVVVVVVVHMAQMLEAVASVASMASAILELGQFGGWNSG